MKTRVTAVLAIALATLGAACEKDVEAPRTQGTEPAKKEAPAPKAEQSVTAEPVAALAANAVCSLSGAVGAVVSCPLNVAAVSGSPSARALQATLTYDPAVLRFVGLYQAVTAPNGEQVDKAIDGSSPALARTGHTVVQSPAEAAKWAGKGSLVIAHLNAPTTPVTTATQTDGEVEGDASLLVARFELLGAVDAKTPSPVVATGLLASDEAARPLTMRVEGGVLVTGGSK